MRPMLGALRRSAVTEEGVRELTGRVQRQRDGLDKHQRRLVEHRERLESQRERLDKQRRDIDTLRGELKRQAHLINEQKKAMALLKGEIQPLKQADRLREVDWGRAIPQIGALEARLGRLEEAISDGAITSDDTSVADARSLVDTVRREHDQVRVRFQVISSYEERVRRLEAAVISMYDGDMRDPL